MTLSLEEAADQLREQAICCRRLARNSRTELASVALLTVATQFEADAFRMERHAPHDFEGYDFEGYDFAQERIRAASGRKGFLLPVAFNADEEIPAPARGGSE